MVSALRVQPSRPRRNDGRTRPVARTHNDHALGQTLHARIRQASSGQTVDFRLSASRDVAAAKAFFAKAIKSRGLAPKAITLDAYAASHRAVREMKTDDLLPEETTLRSSEYLNNLIEQDYRNIKSRVNAMLAFKRFRNAVATIVGIELTHRIREGQFESPRTHFKDTRAPAVWKAVLPT
jgi:transposase-like protein